MPNVDILEADLAALVVVDVQEKMLAAIGSSPKDGIVEKTKRLIAAAQVLEIPILWTEQYPKGLGPTEPAVRKALPDGLAAIEKTTCSCWRDEAFRSALQSTGREHVILAGLETHVCIQQTALDLFRVDYSLFVAADAIGSRFESDHVSAVARMAHAGVQISSAEALLFELIERCDHPKFKEILKLVK
jgi:nicotinamidase-related amidase